MVKELYEVYDDEYKDILVKEEYEIYPKISYPSITIKELTNDDVSRYFDEQENVSYIVNQIEIRSKQNETNTALQNVDIIGNIIDKYFKTPKYRCLRRIGGFTKTPMKTDNNVIIGYLRYECNLDIKNNIIYRR